MDENFLNQAISFEKGFLQAHHGLTRSLEYQLIVRDFSGTFTGQTGFFPAQTNTDTGGTLDVTRDRHSFKCRPHHRRVRQ